MKDLRIAAGVIVAIPFIAIALYVAVDVSIGATSDDQEVSESVDNASAPRMTDAEFEQLKSDIDAINPAIVDQGTRGRTRDTCSSLGSERLIQNTVVRFSNADHDVTEGEAEKIAQAVREIGLTTPVTSDPATPSVTMHHTWRELRERGDGVVLFTKFTDGRIAATGPGNNAIWLDLDLNQVERRCALADEQAHMILGHTSCTYPKEEATATDRAEAHRLGCPH